MAATPILDGLRAGQAPVDVPGETHAVLVEHGGERLCAFYANDASVPCGPDTTHRSWSVAKSITHALVGFMVDDGLVDVDAPAAVPEWRHDTRADITLRHLLTMRSGLAWNEEYSDSGASDVVNMLWGAGASDVAAYASDRPLSASPGRFFYYSSGTTNIICRVLGDLLGGGTPQQRRSAMEAYLTERLFAPVGMERTTARFDAAGTFIGSSFMFATATDYLRFGQLYAHDGCVGGNRLLASSWVEGARTKTARGEDPDLDYSTHWWLFNRLPGSVAACGYEGQFILVLPEEDLVVVRLGKTPVEDDPAVRSWLVDLVGEILT